MAKYSVTYSCGHIATKQLYGPTKDREAYIAYARASRLCPDCYRAAQEELHAAENQASAAANARDGLPALHGSPKQVAWAETIRRQALDAAGNQVRVLTARPGAAEHLGITPAEAEMHVAVANARAEDARRELEHQASASWWIDHQDCLHSYVSTAQRTALLEATEDLRRHLAEEREAREERTRQEDQLRREAEERARGDARMREVVRAQTFRVADGADSVEARPYRAGGELIIHSRDGRIACGYIDEDGEWVVHQVGTYTGLSSMHPEIERIAREAKAHYEARWSADATEAGRTDAR